MQQLILGTGTAIWWMAEPDWQVQCLLDDATLIDSQIGRLCQLIDRAIVYQLIDTKLIDWPN